MTIKDKAQQLANQTFLAVNCKASDRVLKRLDQQLDEMLEVLERVCKEESIPIAQRAPGGGGCHPACFDPETGYCDPQCSPGGGGS